MGRWVGAWGSVCKTAGSPEIGSEVDSRATRKDQKQDFFSPLHSPSILSVPMGCVASIIKTRQEREGLKANTTEKVTLVSADEAERKDPIKTSEAHALTALHVFIREACYQLPQSASSPGATD